MLKKREYKNSIFNIFENGKIVFGYTETGFKKEYLSEIYKCEILDLKQIHSDIVFFSSDIRKDSEGDGIILDQHGKLIIIRTADCTPLFFFSNDFTNAGIIHIGWRGLFEGIENQIFEKINVPVKDINFYIGPSIESNCYEVGVDLYDKFKDKKYRDRIFTKKSNDKYFMDVNLGITLSLLEKGIKKEQMSYSNICTFCDKNLPSYRRDRTKERIFNFMLLKPKMSDSFGE